MKLLALIFAFAVSAQATPATDFFDTFAGAGELARSARAMTICEGWFAMPVEAYKKEVLAVGEAWRTRPAPAEFLLDTCNGMWGAQVYAPVALKDTQRAQKIAAYDLVEIAKSPLPVRIRAYVEGRPANAVRPAPFEVLYGMASSKRELDLEVSRGLGASQAMLLAIGGSAVAEALLMTAKAARVASTASMTAGRVAQAALAFGVITGAVALGADYYAWRSQEKDQWARIDGLAARLRNLRPEEDATPLIGWYVEAVERLGHFYNYELYVSQNGADVHPEATGRCSAKLAQFFAAPESRNWGVKMQRHTICKDPAAVWAGASQYLRQAFPNNPEAARRADGLMAHAKRTYTIYLESAAYADSQPVCTPKPSGSIFQPEFDCRDRITGEQVI